MSRFQVRPYAHTDKALWNDFIRNAKNATFLFFRDFMEYHQDRFEDHSLMVYKEEKLVAVLPANQRENVVHSHQGLTYGGLVLSKKLKFEDCLASFQGILQYLHEGGIKQLVIKTLPDFYSSYPSQEIDYLLFLVKASLFRTDLASVIFQEERLPIQGNRKEGVKKANKQGLIIKEEPNFKVFWDNILLPNLKERHEAKPTHTEEEIAMLASRFPKHIHQFNVYHEDEIVAGATVFETLTTAHIQYISANKDRQQLGSLDLLFQFLIEERFNQKRYFNFGISNENQGRNVNKGLLYWKETFGARTMGCKFYEVDTANYELLDDVFF